MNFFDCIWFSPEHEQEALMTLRRLHREECMARRIDGIRFWFDAAQFPDKTRTGTYMIRDFPGSIVCGPHENITLDGIDLTTVKSGLVGGRFKNFESILQNSSVQYEAKLQVEREEKALVDLQNMHDATYTAEMIKALGRLMANVERPWWKRIFRSGINQMRIDVLQISTAMQLVGELDPFEPAWNPIPNKRKALAAFLKPAKARR